MENSVKIKILFWENCYFYKHENTHLHLWLKNDFLVLRFKKNVECCKFDQKENVYKYFRTINAGYPGILGQKFRIKKSIIIYYIIII
jgi:hypothetical protein